MSTLRGFIARNKIRMSADWADSNPNMDHDTWHDSASHWRCTLMRGHKRMTVYFSMGSAHTGEPDIEQVLDSLVSDAAGVENARSFEEWCDEYGYDTDSRKAERTYKACEREARNLARLLGDDKAYQELLFNTERL